MNLPPDMIARMNGHCGFIEDYEPAQHTNYWQCGQTPDKRSFPFDGSTQDKDGRLYGYMPSNHTTQLWSEATGVSEEALRSIKIGSGASDHELGLWCAMPLPGDPDDPANQNTIDYWKTCVQPKAGYFNALQCKVSLCVYALGDIACII